MTRGTKTLLALVALTTSVACGSSPSGDGAAADADTPDGDHAPPPTDSGLPPATSDAGAGSPGDAGTADANDADAWQESGAVDAAVDAPAEVDAGVEGDAGSDASGGLVPDAAIDTDAAVVADAGIVADATIDADAEALDATDDSAADVGDESDGAADSSSVILLDGGSPPDASVPPVVHYVPGVTVATIAGSDVPGTQDGTGAAAELDNPTGLAIDPQGNLLVTDYDGARVRLVTPAGVVTTIGMAPGFAYPFAAVVATDGAYYVGTDADGTGVKGGATGTVWRVTPLADGGVATPSLVAQGFGRPRGLSAIAGGNLFVSDRSEDVTEDLTVATGAAVVLAGAAGAPGFLDATGAAAEFDLPVGAATLADGSVLVADSANNRIRRVSPAGAVTTFAGDGVASLVDASCLQAGFNGPRDVAVDAAGNVYVSDIGNHVVRRIDTSCVVETLAGDGSAGFQNGPGSAAEFYGQEGIDVTPDGRTVYLADGNGGDGSAYHRVRSISIP